MELRHLRYFLAVAETSNFTRAAAQCFVAQSALSQQVARLETELGVPLFFRSSRAVRLTDAGELLVPLARRLLADAELVRSELDALSGLRRGRLRLGLLQTAASAVDLVEVVGDFHERYPDVELDVVNDPSNVMVSAVVQGALDVAVVGVGAQGLPPGLDHRVLANDALVGVVASRHPVPDRVAIDLAELSAYGQFIHFRRGSGLRHHVDAALARAGVAASATIEVGQIQDMVRLAARNVGVTVVPHSAVTGAYGARLIDQEYRVLPLSDPQAVHPVAVVHDPARASFATTAFVAVLDSWVSGAAPAISPTDR